MDAKAESFAVEGIRAVGRKDAPAARTFIAQAYEADRNIGHLADAVYLACAEIEEDDGVSTSTWNTLADAVDSSELLAAVEASRS